MILPAAYWDTSALIPLCVLQPQSTGATGLYETCRIVTWWASEAEIMSGLMRLKRMKHVSNELLLGGKRQAAKLKGEWMSVGSERIVADACSLLESHTLRAADALHLSAALEACEHKCNGYHFVTADRQQADAAHGIGFTVDFLET